MIPVWEVLIYHLFPPWVVDGIPGGMVFYYSILLDRFLQLSDGQIDTHLYGLR